MMKEMILFVFMGVLAVVPVQAQGRSLSENQIQRVKMFKSLIAEVDLKSLTKTVSQIERDNDPDMALQIQETIARVYSDIVAEQAIKDLATKEWLYHTVALNMANIQFGGKAGRDPVNRMIVGRLMKVLPAGITSNPNFYVSVE